MSLKVGELYATLGLEDKEFDRALKGAGQKMQAAGKKISGVGSSMLKNVTAPILGAGVALFGLAQKTANAGDQVQKMALRTGFSTEALSEYKHAAELSGASLESLEKGVKRMQKTIWDAEKGLSTATDALNALGLSSKDLQGIAPEAQFDRIAMALAGVEDPSRRAALAQELFGRAGTEMLPMLDAGAEGIAAMRQEARELGIVFDQEAADNAAKFNDDLLRLKKGFTGVFQELAGKLIPVFVDSLIPMLQENVIPLVGKLGEGIGKLITWFSNLDPAWQKVIVASAAFFAGLGPLLVIIGQIIGAVGTITTALPALGAAFTALTGPVGLIVAAIAGLTAAGVALYQNWDEIKGFADKTWGNIKNAICNAANSVLDFLKEWGPTILAVLTGPIGLIVLAIVKHWDEIKEGTRAFAEGVISLIVGLKDGVVDSIKRMAVGVSEWFTDVKEKNIQRIKDLWDGITKTLNPASMLNAFKNGFKGALDYLKSLPREVTKIGGQIVDGLVKGMSGMVGKAVNAAKNMGRNVINGVKGVLGIKSPSRVFMGFGKNVVEGFVLGIERFSGKIGAVINNAFIGPMLKSMDKWSRSATEALWRVDGVFKQVYINRGKEIENWYEQQKAAIEASMMSEEERAAALAELDTERDARQKELTRKQAIREKASALMSAIVNTAQAVTKALPNIPLATVVGALGAAQAAAIAAEPLPALAKGGNIKAPGAVLVGERGPEILNLPRGARVTPLDHASVAGSPGSGTMQVIQVYLDGRQIARTTAKHFPATLRLVGASL